MPKNTRSERARWKTINNFAPQPMRDPKDLSFVSRIFTANNKAARCNGRLYYLYKKVYKTIVSLSEKRYSYFPLCPPDSSRI